MRERPFHARDDLPICGALVPNARGKLVPCERAPDPASIARKCEDCDAATRSGTLTETPDAAYEREERAAIRAHGGG